MSPPPAASSFQSLDLDGVGVQAQYPKYEKLPAPQGFDAFLQRAHDVAALLALDVAERDKNNVVPYAQVQLLKDSGLVTAIGPAEFGGGGLRFADGYKLQRIIAGGDGSIGQLLAYHYLLAYAPRLLGSEEQIRIEEKRYTERRLFYGGAVNARDADLVVTESEDGSAIIFNGRKAFSTGSKISDLTVMEGVLKRTDTHIFAIAESKVPGIVYGDDWTDVLGMRGTQSGSITISDVSVPWSRALGFTSTAPHTFQSLGAWTTLLLPLTQLDFVNFYLGIAEGALKKAAGYTTKNTRGWPYSDDPKPSGQEEFYIQEIYGQLQAKVWGLEAQVDQLGDQIQALVERKSRTITEKERGEIAVRVAAAKINSTEVALDVTNRIYEVMGARSVALKAGFDHFWRNARTHTLHDPVAHKKAEVGRYLLKGQYPTPSWYT